MVIYKIDECNFNAKNIFSIWLCARWMLLIDTVGRFPSPSAKPTVSNP